MRRPWPSASHTIGEGLKLDVAVTWTTDLSSDGTDEVVLTSPTNVQYNGTTTPAGATTSHSLTRSCTCEPGYWTYLVKSTRAGYTPSQVANQSKTFRVVNCLD